MVTSKFLPMSRRMVTKALWKHLVLIVGILSFIPLKARKKVELLSVSVPLSKLTRQSRALLLPIIMGDIIPPMLDILLLVDMTIALGSIIPELLGHPRATESELPLAGMPTRRL